MCGCLFCCRWRSRTPDFRRSPRGPKLAVVTAARVAGELSDLARSKGFAPGFADIVIGATARTRQLIILTQNIRHFTPLGIPTVNPFRELPALTDHMEDEAG